MNSSTKKVIPFKAHTKMHMHPNTTDILTWSFLHDISLTAKMFRSNYGNMRYETRVHFAKAVSTTVKSSRVQESQIRLDLIRLFFLSFWKFSNNFWLEGSQINSTCDVPLIMSHKIRMAQYLNIFNASY